MTNLINSKYFDRAYVWALIVFSFLLTFSLSLYGGILSPDGMQYASLGKNLVDLKSYVSDGSHFPDIIQPPLYPLLIALLYIFLRDPHTSGFAVSCIFNALAIFPLFFIALRVFNRTTAVLSVLLFAVHPLFLRTTLNIGSDSMYLFFFLCIVSLILGFIENPNLSSSMLIGLSIGLAYATRIESVVLLPFFALLVYTSVAKKNIPKFKTKIISTAFLGFFVIYGALTLFVYQQTGQLMLCPKYQLISAHKQIWRNSESNPGFKGASFETKTFQTFFKYDPETRDLLANRLFYKKDRHPGKNEGDFGRDNRKSIQKVFALLFGMAKTFVRNIHSLYKQLVHITVFPPLLYPFVILGFFGIPWDLKRWRDSYHLLCAILVSLLFLFTVDMQLRFLCPAVSLLLLWCAEGIVLSSQTLSKSLANIGTFRSQKTFIAIITIIVILSAAPSAVTIVAANQMFNKNHILMAEAIEKHVPKEATVISSNPQAAYLAHRRYAPLPYLTLDELKVYTTKFKQSAVILSDEDKRTNPQLTGTLYRNGEEKTGQGYTMVLEKGYVILLFNPSTP